MSKWSKSDLFDLVDLIWTFMVSIGVLLLFALVWRIDYRLDALDMHYHYILKGGTERRSTLPWTAKSDPTRSADD